VLPGQYFVRVHPGAIRPHVPARARAAFGPARMAFGAATANAVPEAVVEPLQYLRDNTGMKNVRPLFADAGRTRVSRLRGAAVDRARLALAASVVTQEDDDIAGLAIAEFDPKADARTIAHAASANAIDYIEPVPARWLMATDGPAAVDPMQNLQWGLRAVRWFDGPLPDASSATVGILDTGIDAGHPDLAAVRVTYDHTGTRAEDIVGHGTHVAGIVKLVAPEARIMPLRVLDREGYGTVFHVAEAIAYADIKGADVINLSLGTPSWSRLVREKVNGAIAGGAVVVAAAGNYDSTLPQYPASNLLPAARDNDGLLAVTSVSPAEKKSDFANYGTWVDIAAPGEEILSTYPVNKYAYWTGTSMATPFVAGEAALIHTDAASLGPARIEKRIRLGARCVDEKNEPLYRGMLGAGHADVYGSLKQVEGYRCIPVIDP
jgi:subtilisin family serine protease